MNQKISRLSFLLPYLYIILFGVVVYGKSFTFELTYFDDNVWVLEHHWMLKNLSSLKTIFLGPDLVSYMFYRPILGSSFVLNAFIGGADLFGFRLFNLLIHLASACILYKIFLKLKYPSVLSLSFSLFFLLHPVLTQAVVWIPGRTDSLLGLLVLSSYLLFLNFLKKKTGIYLILHSFLFLCALLTKETAIVLPIICLLSAFVLEEERIERKKSIPPVLVWMVVIFAWLLLRKFSLSSTDSIPITVLVTSLLSNLPAILLYLGKILLPLNLTVLPTLEDSTLVYGIISFFLLILLIVRSEDIRIKRIMLGVFWFLLFLLPSLVLSQWKHEYRLYLPMIGIFIILMETSFINHLFCHQKNYKQWIFMTALTLGIISSIHSEHFKDRVAFWQKAVKDSPNAPLAHRNLGAMYYMDNMKEEAKKHFYKAKQLNKNEEMVNMNLGLIYMNQGDYKKAEQYLIEEVRINRNYANAYYNLGILYHKLNETDKAKFLWRKTIDLDPYFVEAYQFLLAYAQKERDQESFNNYSSRLKSLGLHSNKSLEEAVLLKNAK